MLIGKPQQQETMGDIQVLESYLKRMAQPVRAPATGAFVQRKK